MEQYIPKSVVLAEIRKYKNNAEAYLKYHHNRNDKSVYAFEQEKLAMCELLSSLDTLEVIEVDLKKETKKWWKEHLHLNPENKLCMDAHQSVELAKHFYGLGLEAQKGK